MIPVARAALHRRIAIAHSLAGNAAQAAGAAETAAELYAEAGHPGAAARARIEAATALAEAGLASASARAIAVARDAAGDDRAAQAELDLLESARALQAGDAAAALSHARHARSEALAGGAVLPYAAAAIAIAELLDRVGDREGAYDSLAVGWVTAGDKIGNELAGALFRPQLEALRARWGATAFDEVKAAYYARRRGS
jgi:hypothetical protein